MAKEWDDTFETFDELVAGEWNDHVTDQKNHSGRHEDGGADELNVSGLSGVLADAQTPQTEAVEDIVGGLLQAAGNISLNYDDANNTLTIDTSALNTEEVEDAVAALVTAGNAITVNYDDANDSLSIAVDESSLSFYDGTNLTADVDNQSVRTERVASNYHYAKGYAGSDPEARLSNAISAATTGDTIYLENVTYTSDITVGKGLKIIGPGGIRTAEIGVDTTWTFNDRVWIESVRCTDPAPNLQINGNFSFLKLPVHGTGGTYAIEIGADKCRISTGTCALLFESGSSGGLVDMSEGVTVTDNGSNTVGDIA